MTNREARAAEHASAVAQEMVYELAHQFDDRATYKPIDQVANKIQGAVLRAFVERLKDE